MSFSSFYCNRLEHHEVNKEISPKLPDQVEIGAVRRPILLPVEHCSTSNAAALSAALCLCCVCFCELLKNQEKQKAEGEERRQQSFSAAPLPISSFYFPSPLQCRPFLQLTWQIGRQSYSSSVILFSSAQSFFIYSLLLLFSIFLSLLSSFVSFSDFFFFLPSQRAFFSLSDLVFFVTDTHTGLGNCGGQQSKETSVCEMKKKNKTRGESDRKGYLGREEKDIKKDPLVFDE